MSLALKSDLAMCSRLQVRLTLCLPGPKGCSKARSSTGRGGEIPGSIELGPQLCREDAAPQFIQRGLTKPHANFLPALSGLTLARVNRAQASPVQALAVQFLAVSGAALRQPAPYIPWRELGMVVMRWPALRM